jgi:mediator of RNA polymerase II transcription subunit 12
MPLELKHQFRTLLPYVAVNPAVKNLFYPSRQADGTLTYHGPVQNRPWEWTEYLGDDNPDEFRNSGSLNLELFDTKLTGDHLLDVKGLSERAKSSLQSLRNDVVYENIFERDWREGRVPTQAGTPPECGSRLGVNDEDEDGSSKMQRGQLNSRGTSPASSVRSRISAASFRSPSVSSQPSRRAGSTDVIEVDSIPSTSSTRTQKRKASGEVGEDENGDKGEVQVVDNPDPGAFKKKSGTKGRSAGSKSRTKKR